MRKQVGVSALVATMVGGAVAGAHDNQAVLAEAYGKLPHFFEPNRGQTDPRVSFLSRGDG